MLKRRGLKVLCSLLACFSGLRIPIDVHPRIPTTHYLVNALLKLRNESESPCRSKREQSLITFREVSMSGAITSGQCIIGTPGVFPGSFAGVARTIYYYHDLYWTNHGLGRVNDRLNRPRELHMWLEWEVLVKECATPNVCPYYSFLFN